MLTLRTLLFTLAIILLSLPALSELFQPGYFTTHDGEGHIIRLEEFDIAVKDGQIPPRLSKNLMFGYGFYFFNFNYPLVYYLGEAAHSVGFNFTDSIKIVCGAGLTLSGIAMFFWQRKYWGDWGAFVAGILYMYAPYRLLNMYVRGSVAEHISFVMLPVLFMFTEMIAEGDRRKRLIYIPLAGAAYALLMLSHNITAFIFTVVLALFMLFHFYLYRSFSQLFSFIAVGITGLLLSAYFWLPSLAEKSYVRLDQTIARDYPDHFVYPIQLIQRNWGYGGSGPGLNDGLSFQIGIFHLILLLVAAGGIFLLKKSELTKAKHLLFYLSVFVLSLFFMFTVSKPLWDHLPLLSFTQFPWRFLSWTVFATSVLGAAAIYLVGKKFGNFVAILFSLAVIFLLLLTSRDYWKANQHVQVMPHGDVPLSGSTTWADEQFPIWFNPKPTSAPQSHIEFSTSGNKLSIDTWKTGVHEYKAENSKETTVIENTAYYPGWNLYVDGAKHDFNYQDKNYPGRIVYSLKPGQHTVKTIFEETTLRKISDFVSLITFLAGVFTILSQTTLLKRLKR